MKTVSEFTSKANNPFLNECVIVAKKFDDNFILAKNRDRPYNPELCLVHEILDSVEIAYLHDVDTDWSEGMNQYGISIVNSALFVRRDEAEKKGDKANRHKVDGSIIRDALTKPDIDGAVEIIKTKNGGLKGHTLVTDGKKLISIEITGKDKIFINEISLEDNVVRTNHGLLDGHAGYKNGISYKSSSIRKSNALKQVSKAETKDEVLERLRKRLYKSDSMLNTKRDTKKIWTSSQFLLDPTNLEVKMIAFSNKIDGATVESRIPEGYQPKINITLDVI